MKDSNRRPEGASALAHLVGKGFRRAATLFVHLIVDLLAIAVLSTIMGSTNDAAFLAIAIVVGAEIGLRRYEKKKAGQFGETARGTEVADHTDGGQ